MKKKSGIHLVSIFFMTMLLLGAFAALTTNSVSAVQDGDYTYTQSGGVATITGYTGAGGDITIPSTLGGFPTRTIGTNAFNNVNGHLITSVIIPDSVTSIGGSAFKSCTNMTSVTIGNGVTSIGLSAFQYCNALTSLTIPGSVTTIIQYAFYSCTELTSVTIPNSVTIIGDGAFQLCTKLTSVTIGNGVTSIGISAFQSCTSLTSVTYTPTSKVATIGGNAFWLCTSLTSVTIPNSVTSIGTYAFYSCAALTSVTIGNGVTSIGVGAFYSCTSLTSMTIPDSVTTIGDSAFQECNYLTSVTIGNGVTSIGNSAFYFCNRLTSVTIPNSVTTIGTQVFMACNSLTSVTIGSGVTSIGLSAFYYCPILTSITVDPGNLNYANNAGDGVLYDKAITTLIQYPNRNARTSFTIPSSVTTIGDNAFGHGVFLTAVTIPADVTTIGSNVFYSCSSLTSITFHGLVAPTSVGANWIQSVNAGVTGHAYYGSNFPKSTDVPNTFNGLTMGTTVAEDYTYTLTDGKATITAYTGAGGAITIPDHLPITSANDVVAIGAGAFDNAAGHTVSSIVSMPDTLTSIGTNAFRSCSLLTTIAIGNGINSIGNYAFQSCTALTSVTIPDSVTYIGEYAFRSCSALTSVTIPGSVTSIKQGVFYSCSALTSVTIPGSVTSIQLGAFFYCTSLTSVTIPDNVTSIGDYAFQSCTSLTSVTIPDNVTSIGKNAFQSCTSLTSVTIPGSVTSIGDYTFQSCTSLTSVTIPGSVTSIGIQAFHSCSALTSVTIPDNVTSIGDYAFYSCTSLTSVTIPDSVISIGTRAFYSCTALTAITVDPDNVNYANNADDGVLYNKTITKLIQCPIGNERTSFTIPGSVTSIGDYAFAGTRLTSVTIPANVTSIGSNVFYSCSSLTSITFHGLVAPTSVAANWIQNVPVAVRGYAYSASNFPDTGSGFYGLTMGDHIPIYLYTVNDGKATITGCTDVVGDITIPSLLGGYEVVAIGDSAFATNILLTSVVIPNSVTSIGDYAFQSCTALTSLTIGNGVTTIGDRAFDSCTSLTSLTIPNGVTSIGSSAFQSCTSLTSVTIGSGVTSIGDSAFLYCTALPAITVDPDNVNYANNAGDGVLYNKAITTLIQYPKGNVQTSFTVPDSVTTIGQSAFYYCFSLTSVTIGNSVTTIGQSAFYYCISLTSMIFLGHDVPTSVGTNWILGTPVGMVGHAYSTSNFPTPGNVFPEGQSRGDNGLLMSPGIVTHCVIDIVGDQIAGVGWSGTATAYDEFDNVVTTDSATAVTMTSTGAATFYTSETYETPGNTFTLSSGVATFFVKDHTAQTITLTATVNEENIGTIADILVGPATIDHYHVSSSTPQTAGLGWSDMATAHDAFHNVVTTDSATVVTMTSTGDSTFYTDGDYDVLGNTYTLSSGIATYYVKDTTAQTITLTATSAGSKTGTSSNIVVNPASIDHYHVASSTPHTAGSGWSGTATAQDAFHNVVTTDSVTVVTMTATGAAAFYTDGDYDVLGNTYALSSGVATYFVKDNIAQTITLTATDETDKTGNIVDILVNPAAIDHYHLASASPQTAGVGWSGTATAHDVFHNVVTTDSITEVTITSNGDATFYSNGDYDVETTTYTLSAGVATFFVKDTTAQTITLTATSVESMTGSITNIVINPAAIDHYHVASLTPQTAGAGWSGTATALDIFDNVVTPDSVTVVTMTGTGDATFYTSGTYGTLGDSYTLSSGVATFYVKDTTAQTITLTATSVGSKTGVSGNIVVNPAAIDHYHVASSIPQTAGAGWSGTATAHDAFHNVVTTDSTTVVTMTSTGDPTFYTSGTYETPGNTFTLSSGVATFFVKDNTAQTITLTANDPAEKTGSIADILVNPEAIDHYHVASTTPQTADTGWIGTATAQDAFHNVVTTDSTTVVTMTSNGVATFYTDGTYNTPGNTYTMTAGVVTYFVKDHTAQTITLTATSVGSKTGTSDNLVVNPAAIDHYHVASSTPQTAGVGWSGTATAHDAFHNVVTTDSATVVTMTSTGEATFYTDGNYDVPGYSYTLSSGIATFFVKDNTAQTITLTATSTGPKTGTSGNIVVNPAAIDHYHVASSTPQTAGAGWSGTATAHDAFHNVVTTDSTTVVTMTSTGAAALYTSGTYGTPGNTYTMTAGVATYFVKDNTAQTITLTATDYSENTGSVANIVINPTSIDHYHVASSTPQTAGAGWSGTATAHDIFDNVVTTDSTTEVTMTSTGDATFYSNGDYDVETTTYTLSAGVATFYVKDTTAQTITLTATSAGSKTGSVANIVVNPTSIDHYHFASESPQIAGAGWSGTATAHDIFDNVVTIDSATVVTMTATGAAAFYTSGTYGTSGNTYVLSSGVATFFVRDTTAQTITLTATSAGSKTGVSGNIVVNPAAIDHYHFASTTPQTAGTGWTGTARAQDAFHNVETTDSATVVTMTANGAATFYTDGTFDTPGNTYTMTAGVVTYFVKDNTAQTITLTATSAESKTGTSDNIAVNPASIDHYHVASSTSQTAGVGWSGTATAHDIFDNVVTTDSITVVTMTGTGDATFYSNGDYDVLGNVYTLSSGIATFFVKDNTAQTITLTANDPAEKTGSIADILINPSALDHYHVASSTPQTAGVGWSGTATAHDAFHNVVTTDSTTVVTMTSTGEATFYTSGSYDTPDNTYTTTAGVLTYFVKDNTAQTITLTVTSAGSKTGSTANIVVNPAAIDHFTVAGITDPVVAGILSSVTVTAYDAYDNVKTDYVGTIHFTSTDVKASTVLPADYTFLLADEGMKTFADVIKLTTTGQQSVTVTSTVGSETGSQTAITVNPAALDHFDVTVGGEPLTKVAGALWSTDANDVVVTAHDEFNNVVTGFTGSPVWSSSCDGTFPEAEVFELGTYTFTGTGFALEESGEQTITMTDGSISGTSATIEITPAALDHFTMTGVPASCIAGTSWAGGSGIVTAYDLYDNVKTNYTGQVYFTSTDGAATLPYTSGSKYTFTTGEGNDNGAHEFSGAGFTLFTTGSRTITLTTGVISLASAPITVTPAVLDHFTVTDITDPVVAGVLTSPTVTAYDAYDNVKTDYVGTIHFTSTDVKASTVLPNDFTFSLSDAGMKTFTDGVKFTTTGDQTVTVTSTVGPETGSQTAITVTLAALDHYQVYSTTPQVAGVGWYGTATAHDVFHNVVTTDSTTVVTMTSNGAATFYTGGTYDTPDNTYTMTAGVLTYFVKDNTAQTITLTAISAGAAPGVATGIVVSPAAIDHFDVAVGGTLSFVAGAPWATSANDVVVTAHDEFSNVVTSYTGSPEWSASCAGTLPSPQAFVGGTYTFIGTGFVLNTEGAQTITMTDGSITGSSANIAVTHSVAVNLVLTPGGVTVVAGTSQSNIATATDAFGNSWNVTDTTVFEIDLHAAGSWTDDVYLSHSAGMAWVINGTDSVSGIKATTTLTVTPAAIHHFTVNGILDPLIAGTPTTPVVTAYDAYGNIKTDYTGTIHFTSDDEMGGTILPGDYTFIVSDEGIKIFSDGVTIISSGEKYVKVQDTVTIAATGQQSAITVYTIPDAPTGFTAIADNGQITLNWTAPLFDGGSAIDYYRVYQNGAALPDTPTGLSTVITGLTNGGSYSFAVSAHNIAGYGPNSTSATAVPRTVPDALTDLVATPGNGQVSLSWTAPAFDGGRTIDYYVVYQNGVALPGHPSGLTTAIVGLTNGQVYSFAVTAYNIAGEGAPSSSIASTPYTVPNVLTGLSAIPGNAQVTLNWTASAFDGGRIVDYYVVYQNGVALPDHVTGLSTIITGLTNGQYYTFMVAAHNIAGIGALSDPSNVIPFAVPDAPILNTITAGVANVTLVWTAPASDGSSPITGYEIFFRTNDTDAAWTWFSSVGVAASSETVTGLTAGATYQFGVKAVNAAGSSVMSGSLNATVLTVPDAPTSLTSVASSSQVTISWNAPDGLVDGYLVYRGSSAADAIPIGNSTIASFVDTAVTAGSIYYYKVIALNAVGEGAMSEIVSVQVPFPALVPVSGMILDASGNGLAGVTISLENGSSVLTDAQGNFLIMASQGNHTLTVSGDGIETSRTEFNLGGSSLVLNSITPVKAADSLPLTLAVTIIAIGLMLALIFVVLRGKGKK